ncbi:hypothetical protein [Pontibacillus halophilus]|uniref:hypothetical protein n=1 Tax=Pontibacillus halophilus TaxID=516704 RepID=UPI000410993A|nr:hypothetical protein [Pontibacillus halophilus]
MQRSCEVCGKTRQGTPKFCDECGTKFKVSNEEKLLNLKNEIKASQEELNNSYYYFEPLKDKQSYITKYEDLITKLGEYADFLRDNNEELISISLVQMDSMVKNLEYIEGIKKTVPYRNSRAEIGLATSKKLKDAQRVAVFPPSLDDYEKEEVLLIYKEFLIEKIKYLEDNLQIYSNDPNAYNLVKNFSNQLPIFKKLLILYETVEFKEYLRIMIDDNVKEFASRNNIIDEKESTESLDVLEVADLALSMTSPVSAARYFIKRMKN